MKTNIPNKCLRCNKDFGWNEVIIGKMPENAWFCMECMDYMGKVAPDTKIYDGNEAWIMTEYAPGLTVSNE